MSEVKQVKVDNWGIYFLQRLKHFFNRTDYCDLTLQFQDNAQLKVHRLVLSACTEYFELLERTCEMYEDCLVMPDDLQADVVVPIVNFMYTGQLEFKMEMLEKLYQTSLIMNMPVLSKLLDAHRSRSSARSAHSFTNSAQRRNNRIESVRQSRLTPSPSSRVLSNSSSNSNKRSYSNAFQNATSSKPKVKTIPVQSTPVVSPTGSKSPHRAPSPMEVIQNNKRKLKEPRPTRYELPEELDTDNIFENSFASISYTSTPLMVHPESTKHYPSRKDSLHKKIMKNTTMEIVECKRMKSDNIFEDDVPDNIVHDESDMFQSSMLNDTPKDPNQLFDQILDSNETSKVVIETKGGKQAGNIDHAKIISEVLKKYPHLVKSNKNIKLKILNTPSPAKIKKEKRGDYSNFIEEKEVKLEPPERDYTFETDVIDSKEAAKLIAMGAENIKGPWICLICGTPGRALHFSSYYKFRRHLVEVHNEKCVPTICEYCGFKSLKRNYMVHHIYTKHGVQPPPQYHFPKCNHCDYVAITEGFLLKHKFQQHNIENKQFRCNVCTQSFHASNQLLAHIQKTGHKYSDKKANLQCIYCLKVFLRESNLYAHLKTNHKLASIRDGIVDDSDEEKEKINNVKREAYDDESEDGDVHYQIQQRADGLHVVSKKSNPQSSTASFNKQKILNPGFSKPVAKQSPQKAKPVRVQQTVHNEFMQDEITTPQNTVRINENIIVIDDVEYIMKENELIPRKNRKEFIIPEITESDSDPNHSIESITPSTSMQFANIQGTENVQAKMILKKSNMNQPIQIVVSNEEEYKALMSSNHSIIFEDGETNKTLTMMSAPHNSALDTTVLENTQSNDMMIIQDDYPLNVSEAVATDNNIVVVYSHPVGQINDDPNKQYQLITSEDIGAQFIQSSAMITQNYETVTTTTPVMSAHVIDAQVHDSWQNNGQQNIENEQVNVTTNSEILPITDIKDANESLIELPEVEISTIPKEISAEISSVEDNINQSTVMNVDEMPLDDSDQVDNAETADISITPMDTDVPCSISNKEIISSECTVPTDDLDIPPVPDNNLIQEQSVQSIHPTITEQQEESIENHEENDNINESCVETVEQLTEKQMELSENINNENVPEEVETMQASDVVGDQKSTDSTTPNIEPAVIKVNKEKIRNLASEWSDDEYEVAEGPVSNETEKSVPEVFSQVEEQPHEMEESIENIQQEVDKQMTGTVAIEKSMDMLNDNTSSEIIESGETTAPQETQPAVPAKLTSLLNDWDDNDSQEENPNESENVNPEVAVTEMVNSQEANGNEVDAELGGTVSAIIPSDVVAEAVGEEVTAAENVDPKKDKIKSLVSDWDDEEEDIKE